MRPIMAKAIGYMQPTIDPSMRLYVPFNEGVGAIAKDYSQYGNHAQFTDVEWSIGRSGNTGVFNGTSSYCDCGNDTSLDITDAITIEAWVKPETCVSGCGIYFHNIVIKAPGNSGGYGIMVNYISVPNKITLYADTDSINYDIPSMGQWYHVVGTIIGGGEFKLYVNGQLQDEGTNTGIPSNNEPVRIMGGVTNRYTNGTIAEVRIYNRALSAAQIAADYYEMGGD